MSTPKKKMGRPKSFERETAVASALENYWRDGLHALSVNEICSRTKISKPALYREFGGEDGLIDAVLALYHDTAIRPLMQAFSASASFDQFAEVLISAVTTERAAERGCLFVKVRDSPYWLGERTKARVENVLAEVRAGYEEVFIRARARGEVRSDVAPSDAAMYLDALVTTLFRQSAAGDHTEVVRRHGRLALDGLLPSREPR